MKKQDMIARCTGKLGMTLADAEKVAEQFYTYADIDWSEASWRKIDSTFKMVLACITQNAAQEEELFAKTFQHPVVEQTVWLQTQSQAGGWVDSIGFPYYSNSGRNMTEAIKEAEASAKYHEETLKMATRIVRKTIEVLC